MPRKKKSAFDNVLNDIAIEDVAGMAPEDKERLFGKPTQKRMVMFNAKKGMGMTKGAMCKCGSGMSKAECGCKMSKSFRPMPERRSPDGRIISPLPKVPGMPKVPGRGRIPVSKSARPMPEIPGVPPKRLPDGNFPMPRRPKPIPPGKGRIPNQRPLPVPVPPRKPDMTTMGKADSSRPMPIPRVPVRRPSPLGNMPRRTSQGGTAGMMKGQGAVVGGKRLKAR